MNALVRCCLRMSAFGGILVIVATMLDVAGADASTVRAKFDVPRTCADEDPYVLGSGTVNAAPWSARYEVQNTKGLVFTDIRAGGKLFLPAVRVPHFVVAQRTGGEWDSEVVQFCASDLAQNHDSVIKDGGRTIEWRFVKKLTKGSVRGTFIATYLYRFGDGESRCAGGQRMAASMFFARTCYRFIPLVHYWWEADDPSVTDDDVSVTAYYRIDYGSVGIGGTSDYDYTVNSFLTAGLAPVFASERSFFAQIDGRTGDFDNLHTALDNDGQRTMVIPGCREYAFDCVHMHWRWSGALAPPVDPLVEPMNGHSFSSSLRGTTYLTPGQTIQIVIAADKGEGDVLDPAELILDRDRLAEVSTCKGVQLNWRVFLKRVRQKHVVWYIAKATGRDNTFMRHGFFALDQLKPTNDGTGLGTYVDNFFEWRRASLCDPKTSSAVGTKAKGQ